MASTSVKKTAVAKKPTAAKKVAAQTESKADLALEIVIRNFNNKIEGTSTRQRVLAELATIGLNQPTSRQTYFNNALVKLRNQQAEAAAKALEANKPVWSVVKVDSNNLVSAVGLFTSAKAAKEFNATYEHHAVVPGVVEIGDPVDERLIKKVAKAPRSPKATVPAKKATVKAKVAEKKAAVGKKTGKASTKKAA